MTPLQIFQLLTVFGPQAIGLIQQLSSIWHKPTLTFDEVMAFCAASQKSFDDYLKAAGANVTPALPGLA